MEAGTAMNITVDGLVEATSYNIYIICGNNMPGFPELLGDEDVYKINWQTNTPVVSELDVEFGIRVFVGLFWIIFN